MGRCGNLLQNPSFESGLSFWVSDNVSLKDENPPEGTQSAQMNSGPSSLFQDVPLNRWEGPLLLSFIAYEPTESTSITNFIAEVLWLNAAHEVIGTGLRANLTNGGFGYVLTDHRITFLDVTDRPPEGTMGARVLFSKGDNGLSAVVLDNLMLAPVAGGNLVQNPGFELGLGGWTSDGFEAGFNTVWEGRGVAIQQRGEFAEIYQDIILGHCPGIPYLLTFAASAYEASIINVRLLWLDFMGQPLSTPGIDVFVNPSVFVDQPFGYTSFVIISEPAPYNAVGARVQFIVSSTELAFTKIDQVLLMPVGTPNLLRNPGFAQGLDAWSSDGVTVSEENAYIGSFCALLDEEGAALWQDVRLCRCDDPQCLLFSFAVRYPGRALPQGNLIAQVTWLDALGNTTGLGARVILVVTPTETQWLNYVVATSRPPQDAAGVRVQFTKNGGGLTFAEVRLDTVVLASLT